MTEKREDYRIEGRAQIFVKQADIKASEMECARGYFMSEELMAFATAYELLSNRSTEAMARLRNSDAELSDVLSLLDQKLNLIEQRFYLTGADENADPQDISLSASGASFVHHEACQKGDRLAIRLTLLPGHTLIYTLARCIRCDQLGNSNYRIAVHFFNLGTQESQLIRRHIMQAERELLRKDVNVVSLSD